MEKAETLQEFYKRKFAEAPGTFTSEIGHFNLFRLEPFVEGTPTNIPYAGEIFIRLCSSWARALLRIEQSSRLLPRVDMFLTLVTPVIEIKWGCKKSIYLSFVP